MSESIGLSDKVRSICGSRNDDQLFLVMNWNSVNRNVVKRPVESSLIDNLTANLAPPPPLSKPLYTKLLCRDSVLVGFSKLIPKYHFI